MHISCYFPNFCHPGVTVQSVRVVEILGGLEVMQGVYVPRAVNFLLGFCLMVSGISSLDKCCTTILAVALQCKLLLRRTKNSSTVSVDTPLGQKLACCSGLALRMYSSLQAQAQQQQQQGKAQRQLHPKQTGGH